MVRELSSEAARAPETIIAPSLGFGGPVEQVRPIGAAPLQHTALTGGGAAYHPPVPSVPFFAQSPGDPETARNPPGQAGAAPPTRHGSTAGFQVMHRPQRGASMNATSALQVNTQLPQQVQMQTKDVHFDGKRRTADLDSYDIISA